MGLGRVELPTSRFSAAYTRRGPARRRKYPKNQPPLASKRQPALAGLLLGTLLFWRLSVPYFVARRARRGFPIIFVLLGPDRCRQHCWHLRPARPLLQFRHPRHESVRAPVREPVGRLWGRGDRVSEHDLLDP